MGPNRVLERHRNGETALGFHIPLFSEFYVEIACKMGLDYVGFDCQHGAHTLPELDTLCRIAEGYGVTCGCRIVDHSEASILTALDRGIQIVTVPNLKTAEEAEQIEIAGFAENQAYGFGTNTMTEAGKSNLIFGGLGAASTDAFISNSSSLSSEIFGLSITCSSLRL